jgi:hypothetical protein
LPAEEPEQSTAEPLSEPIEADAETPELHPRFGLAAAGRIQASPSPLPTDEESGEPASDRHAEVPQEDLTEDDQEEEHPPVGSAAEVEPAGGDLDAVVSMLEGTHFHHEEPVQEDEVAADREDEVAEHVEEETKSDAHDAEEEEAVEQEEEAGVNSFDHDNGNTAHHEDLAPSQEPDELHHEKTGVHPEEIVKAFHHEEPAHQHPEHEHAVGEGVDLQDIPDEVSEY